MPNYEPNYVVGRGRLYFDQFKNGSNASAGGEMYFGNTPELTLNTDSETLDHYSSESGLRNLDMTILLEMTQGGSFTTDEINPDNLALFFLGEKSKVTQTQATGRREVLPLLKKGRYFQLGVDASNPSGVRDVTNLQIVVADASVAVSTGSGDITTIPGATVLPLANNIEVDLAMGRIYVEIDAPDVGNNVQAVVQYDVNAQARTMIIGRSNMVYGALRFISDNPVGGQKDYFFPKVALQPDGDYALKGDDWQVMSFTFRALKLNSSTERCYIDVRDASVGDTPATQRSILVTPAAATGKVGDTVAVTITVRDGFNNVVPGEALTLTTNSGTDLVGSNGSTNASGQLVVGVQRTTAGTAILTATLTSTGQTATSSSINITA